MRTILSLDGISKSYGKIQALENVSYEVPAGAVFGILGPNGSGKTSMLSIVLDIIKSDKGQFYWFGEKGSPATRKRIGSLLETPNFYHYLSAEDNLKITSAISGRGNASEIHAVLKTVKLYERRKSKFSTYSLGMKQRLAIGAALLGNPEVLLLDEPTNGLDPVGIAEIRGLIQELAKQGKTIIMASHLLDEVEKVGTHVAVMKSGKLIAAGEVDAIFSNDDIVEISSSDLEELKRILASFPGFNSMTENNQQIQLYFPFGTAPMASINQHCFENGIVLTRLILKKKSLESKFFELTND